MTKSTTYPAAACHHSCDRIEYKNMIGLHPGPRARTVKPGPRHLHLRTRPDPGQTRLGPHMGIPSGEACTMPAACARQPVHASRYQSCDLSLSSRSPTANQGGAECHHCGYPQQNLCPVHEVSAPHHPDHAKGPDLGGT